jgi:outer membrane protein assembly factor BamB
MLVFKSGGGELFALDAGSGEKRLSIRTLPDHFGFFKDSAPACAPGGVVAGFSGGDLHFVPLEPGLSGWAAHVSRPDIGGISAIGGIVANPVVSGSMAFVKGYSGPMAALDLKKGDVVWSARSGGSATPALSGGTLFDIDSDGVMRAVEAKSGMALWSVVIGADGARLFSPLLVNNRLLVARSDGVLMKYDPYTGAYAGEQKLAPEIDAAPIAADAALFVISGGNLMAFR